MARRTAEMPAEPTPPEALPPSSPPEPAGPAPWEAKIAELQADLQRRDREWADRMERIALGGRGPAPAEPSPEALPTQDEIAQAYEEGDVKRASKLLAKLQTGLAGQVERRVRGELGGAVEAVSARLAKLTAMTAPAQLQYYNRFKAEIDQTIREQRIDATDPDAIRIVHDLVAARHLPELLKEAQQEALRGGEAEIEQRVLASNGLRRRRSGEQSLAKAHVPDELRQVIEDQGFEDENDYAEAKGWKDPSGSGRHWDYMQAQGRKRERSAMPGGPGVRDWVASLREDAAKLRGRNAAR